MSSNDISFDGPHPFTVSIPSTGVDKVIEAVKLYNPQRYLDNLLEKPIEEEDFTYGLPPRIFIHLLNCLTGGFNW
jgi:hypothetical protein